ncbi:glycosyltransferase family 4 protein [Pedobacter heparinus]|uniref:glycosyltransferase family 4 protein n=1 Tax=Pedobacter heparinus TaxID=984 RepID=UPI00292FE161|nr:glycosyltransferase family 4 protein [Pedobacter heparinus]
MRLVIITTHPIQYYAPVFKLLQERGQINIKVFYTWGDGAIYKHDPGFGKKIIWDIPLLEGYDHEFLTNSSKQPGSSHFKGIVNPDAIQRIDAFQPNAILVYGWAYHSHLKILRYYKGKVPVWFRGDSNLIDKQTGLKNILRNVFLRWVYSHVDKAFYVGSANKAYFKKYGLKENRLVFAPHAIDNIRFAENRHTEALALRKSLNIRETDILVLFAGKLDPKKDPELLLGAFMEAARENVHLLILGNGLLELQLKRTVESKKLKRVHFLDFQNQQQMPVAYQACDVFCLPSKGPGETWGLAVNEAMACSKAILVSDNVGCAVDLVKDGYNGMTFKSGDATDIRRCLDQLTSSKALLKQYGSHSSLVIKDWNFLNIALAIENEINEAKR